MITLEPLHENGPGESYVAPDSPMRNLAAVDGVVQGVPADAQQLRRLINGENVACVFHFETSSG